MQLQQRLVLGKLCSNVTTQMLIFFNEKSPNILAKCAIAWLGEWRCKTRIIGNSRDNFYKVCETVTSRIEGKGQSWGKFSKSSCGAFDFRWTHVPAISTKTTKFHQANRIVCFWWLVWSRFFARITELKHFSGSADELRLRVQLKWKKNSKLICDVPTFANSAETQCNTTRLGKLRAHFRETVNNWRTHCLVVSDTSVSTEPLIALVVHSDNDDAAKQHTADACQPFDTIAEQPRTVDADACREKNE